VAVTAPALVSPLSCLSTLAYQEDRKQEVAQEKYNANFEELSGV
jgi:hypothetical protein